jgi:guanylate kinase
MNTKTNNHSLPYGRAIIVSGPSGSGKSTCTSKLREDYPQIQWSVSSTTRKPREGETDGIHYNFISKSQFEEGIKNDEFLEWAIVHNVDYYGTPKQPVLNSLRKGLDVLLELDYQGFFQLREQLDNQFLKSIFIKPFSREILSQLIRDRNPTSDKELENRLNSIEKEVSVANQYDHIITPTYDDIEGTYKRFVEAIFF